MHLASHLERLRFWSSATFGPGSRTAALTDHVRKELAEVAANPGDPEEWIDVAILAFDGALRTGATPEQIVEILTGKQARLEVRKWPDWRTAPADKAIEHVRLRAPGEFKVGDTVRFIGQVIEYEEDQYDKAPPIGWVGVIEKDDKTDYPFKVCGPSWPTDGGEPYLYFKARELELVAA